MNERFLRNIFDSFVLILNERRKLLRNSRRDILLSGMTKFEDNFECRRNGKIGELVGQNLLTRIISLSDFSKSFRSKDKKRRTLLLERGEKMASDNLLKNRIGEKS